MNDRGSMSLRVINEGKPIMSLKEIIWICDGARVADESAMGAINRPLQVI
jgi:hypothetical protein